MSEYQLTGAASLARLKAGVYATYSLDQIPKWIVEKTFLNGRRYSFKGHEFQHQVLQAAKVGVALSHQVQQAPRTGDDDLAS